VIASTPERAQAVDYWNQATEALFKLNERAQRGRVTDHDALFELSKIVGFLTVTLGAMLTERGDGSGSK
jgi:hypothetical protein